MGVWALFCRIIGAIVIFGGLYVVLWGKGKDQSVSLADRDLETANNHETVAASPEW